MSEEYNSKTFSRGKVFLCNLREKITLILSSSKVWLGGGQTGETEGE